MLRKAEEALQTTKRVMNPWEIWLWPWIAGSALTRRALETGHGSMEASNGDAELPRVSEPEWASPNHVTIELDAMRVRDFSAARDKRRSTLIVAPFALHDARIADLSSGHSLIETLRANGCSRAHAARGPDLSDRSFSGKEHGPKHHGVPFRQWTVRTDLESRSDRSRSNHRGGDGRCGGAR